ncbi:Capsular polysaccharide biosynthesis protein [Butyrivibrio hungatei DSM 14810]|uniref:Polysaccharide export protein n=2 Tax=Butyrivibrio hungatei TaxID=185008 RepID=A0A1D9P3X9_9FIRM|nr:Wzz/FepE/Etk N-terminal domain-containing protein [Butyrivibrio hungatei]AOZ97192.1 polysaccharide export protein [Butyrivibrio hungatei]SHN50436.1 Capsular polysaccharide biosynthesis protein [Butyrivibrio hungatei DSM 14810]
MDRKDDIIEINLGELFSILLGRAFLIISAGLFFALSGLFVSKFVVHPTYESTTKIYILNKEENQTVTYSDVQISTQLTQDYAELIKSRYVLEEVIQRLNLIDMEYKQLASVLRVDTPSDTRIVAITVKDEDPLMAMKIANCIREVSSEHITNVMDIDAINIAETANVPTEKASPSVTRWTILSGFVGAVVVAFFVVLGYLLDDTIKSNDDVERYLGLSTLALVPLSVDEQDKKNKKAKKK